MSTTALDPKRMKLVYDYAAERYLRSLPPEHFMEATAQATQREITLESFALVRAMRPDVQCFNELLVQYPRAGEDPDKPGQVVPDNMVVVHPTPIVASTNFATLLQPVGPFLVLEYVSKHSVRKDYEVSYEKYEKELKVPYYLIFYPDADELSLFRLRDGRYCSVLPDETGRLAIPELELEVALHEGWVRYWFRGEVLPLPADLLRTLTAVRAQLETTRVQLTAAQEELATSRVQLTAARDELATNRVRLTAAQDELATNLSQLTATQEELAASRDRARAEAAARAEAEQRAAAAEAELARLRELGRAKPQP